MSEAPPSATPAQSQPPLGISHLMLWILGAAVVLGVYRWFVGIEELPPLVRAVMVGSQLTLSLLAGINIAAVIVYARRLVMRDAPLLVQPGHCLLVIAGVTNVAMWLLYGASRGLAKLQGIVDPVEMIPYNSFSQGAAYAMSTALSLLVLVRLDLPRRWKLSFLLSAVFSGILALTFGVMFANSPIVPSDFQRFTLAALSSTYLYVAGQIVGILVLGFNAIADLADRTPRDWVHRVGVAATILQSMASLAFLLGMDWAFAASI